MRIAILDDYEGAALEWADWTTLGSDAEIVSFDRHLGNPDDLAAALTDFDVVCLLRERTPMPADVLHRLPRLKFIVFSGKGNETLDINAAKQRGIVVSHTSGGKPGGPESAGVIEATWALILACARNICEENRDIRKGDWTARIGKVLNGKTLGIVGLGRAGRSVAAIGAAFGMHVIAWSQNLTEDAASAVGVRAVSRRELFEQSDVVSVHLRLSDRTKGLIGRDDFALMKPTAIFVNTARGQIVDHDALADAIRTGSIWKAGLDVFDSEPLPASHPLQALENAIMTPHVGYFSEENFRKAFAGMVEAIAAFESGHPINPC